MNHLFSRSYTIFYAIIQSIFIFSTLIFLLWVRHKRSCSIKICRGLLCTSVSLLPAPNVSCNKRIGKFFLRSISFNRFVNQLAITFILFEAKLIFPCHDGSWSQNCFILHACMSHWNTKFYQTILKFFYVLGAHGFCQCVTILNYGLVMTVDNFTIASVVFYQNTILKGEWVKLW